GDHDTRVSRTDEGGHQPDRSRRRPRRALVGAGRGRGVHSLQTPLARPLHSRPRGGSVLTPTARRHGLRFCAPRWRCIDRPSGTIATRKHRHAGGHRMIPLRPGQGFAFALGVFALVTGDAPARAQDSVTVVPGPQYAGSGLRGLIFGDVYRAAWATPIRVPVLALDTFAGGLTPTQRGGGNQTISLRFLSHNGREYTFRSVYKFPQQSDEPALHGTLVGTAIQDQVSSLHPAVELMVPSILDAVGVLHPEPSLAVMPDDPALGEFREEFAGMLGIIEERPEEGEGGTAGFGGFSRIVGTETLLERLEEDRTNR